MTKIWEELGFAIKPLLVREVWGRGDVVKTLEEHQTYLIKKLIERGGTITRDDFLSDVSRDVFTKAVPSYYNYPKLEDSIKYIDNQIADLMKSGYIRAIPSGYNVPDFVLFDFLGDMTQAQEILCILSKDLWMAFQFEPYLSEVRELRKGHEKMVDSILAAVEQFNRGLYNDALDSLGVACDELSALIYRRMFGEEKPMPPSPHAKLVHIWNEQHLWKDNPELAEPGRNAAIFLSSAIYIPKWIRDKTSHRLVRPTADAVRLSLVSLLVAIDVSHKLNLLE